MKTLWMLMTGFALAFATGATALPTPIVPLPDALGGSTIVMPTDAQSNGFLPANAVTSGGLVTFVHMDTTLEDHNPITDQAPPPAGCFFDAGTMSLGNQVVVDLTPCPVGTVIHYSCYIHFLPDGTPAMLGTITVV